jgi:beta-lactamase regulating signal transducer with metallopeptidase domain
VSATAKSVIEAVALMGAQGTVLAVLAFLLTRAGRLRPGWQAAVWLVVLAKFALPWGPAMPWSLADLIAALRAHHGPDATIVVGHPGIAAAAPHASSAWLVIAAAWLAGAAIVIGRALVAQHRVTRAARTAPLAPPSARALLAELRAGRRSPRLVLGDPAIGPHVVGVIRPIIVIPPALLAEPALLRAALLHELAHIRRWDALARVVQLIASAVFFFWPVVRLANRRLDLAREAACDAWALEASCIPRPAYARLLVRMAQLRAVPAASLAAPYRLDARVAAVLGPAATARLGLAHWLGLAVWVAIALGGARTAAARGEHVACKYTPQLAEQLRLAHPEADLDGDGVLSRDEACEFQAELRRRVETPEAADQVSRLDEIDESLLTQPLCCNCDRGAENSAPWIDKRSDACPSDEGVSR